MGSGVPLILCFGHLETHMLFNWKPRWGSNRRPSFWAWQFVAGVRGKHSGQILDRKGRKTKAARGEKKTAKNLPKNHYKWVLVAKMAQDTHLDCQTSPAPEFLGSVLDTKIELKSRKMPSKFDVIFDVRFGKRFFTLGANFVSILVTLLEAKAAPGRVSRARRRMCKNVGFISINKDFWWFGPSTGEQKSIKKR